jgi:hypothetical protein
MAGLLGFFVYATFMWKHVRGFLLICAALTFTSYFTTGYFAEYRSYYAQFACGIAFFICAYALLRGDLGAKSLGVAGMFVAASLLLMNLHFITALVTSLSLCGIAAMAWLLGRPRLVIGTLATGLLSALPLAVVLTFQAPYLLGKTGHHFWLETGTFHAMVIISGSIAKGVGANIVAIVAACIVLSRWHDQRPTSHLDTVIGIAILATAASSLGVLLLINIGTPIIVDRYLVLCSAACIVGLSVLAAQVLTVSRVGLLCFLLNAAVFLALSAGKLVGEPRWNRSAELISAYLTTCPSSVVWAFPFPYPGALADEPAVFKVAYRYLAARHGFAVRIAEAGHIQVAGTCPTILWTEHVAWSRAASNDADDLVLDAARQQLGPIDLGGAVVERTKTGALILLRSPTGKPLSKGAL